MLDLPILPAGAMPAPTPGPSGSSPASPEGASFEDALGAAAASVDETAETTSEPATSALPTDESTLAALATLAGAAITVQVPVVPAAPATTDVAPQSPVADVQPSTPTPDVTVLVPVTKPGPRLELADPNPLAPTPQAGARPDAAAPALESAQPIKGAVPGRGARFSDVWVNAVQNPAELESTQPMTQGAVPTQAPASPASPVAPRATAAEGRPAAKAEALEAPTAAKVAPEPAAQAQTVAPHPAATVTETKVEPARLAEVQPKEVIAQVQRAVEQIGEQKLETVKITLHPEELGRIELRVTHGADQGLQVSVRAEQPHTVALLERHLTELQSNLSASGLDVANISISAGLGNQHQQSNRSFHGAKPFGLNLRGIKGGETDPYDSERPIVLRLNGSRGWSNAGVDLSI